MANPAAKTDTVRALGSLIADILIHEYGYLTCARKAISVPSVLFNNIVYGQRKGEAGKTQAWYRDTDCGTTGKKWLDYIRSIAGDYGPQFEELYEQLPDSQPERQYRLVIRPTPSKSPMGQILQRILLKDPKITQRELEKHIGITRGSLSFLLSGTVEQSQGWFESQLCGNTGKTWLEYILSITCENEEEFRAAYAMLPEAPISRERAFPRETFGNYLDSVITFCFETRLELAKACGLRYGELTLPMRYTERQYQAFFLIGHNGNPPIIDVITDAVAKLNNQKKIDRAVAALANISLCLGNMPYNLSDDKPQPELVEQGINKLTKQWRAAMGEVLGKITGLGQAIDPKIISGENEDMRAYVEAAKEIIGDIRTTCRSIRNAHQHEAYEKPLRRLKILCPEAFRKPTPSVV